MTFSEQEGASAGPATDHQGACRPSVPHFGLVPGETKRQGRWAVSPGLKVSVGSVRLLDRLDQFNQPALPA